MEKYNWIARFSAALRQNECFYLIAIILFVLLTACNARTAKTQNTDNVVVDISGVAIREREDAVDYLSNIRRVEKIKYESTSNTSEETYSLMFDIETHIKPKKNTPRVSINTQYDMHVTMADDKYKIKFRSEGDSFFEDGEYMGHSHHSGEWCDDDELGSLVLNYYLLNRDSIPIHTNSRVDISRLKPLFILSESYSSQAHVLEITLSKLYTGTGQFTLECEYLWVENALINNELACYSISSYTLHFIPEGERYYVKMKHNSTKTYTNGGRNMVEVFHDITEATRYADETIFSNKVLQYYLSHKNKFKANEIINET